MWALVWCNCQTKDDGWHNWRHTIHTLRYKSVPTTCCTTLGCQYTLVIRRSWNAFFLSTADTLICLKRHIHSVLWNYWVTTRVAFYDSLVACNKVNVPGLATQWELCRASHTPDTSSVTFVISLPWGTPPFHILSHSNEVLNEVSKSSFYWGETQTLYSLHLTYTCWNVADFSKIIRSCYCPLVRSIRKIPVMIADLNVFRTHQLFQGYAELVVDHHLHEGSAVVLNVVNAQNGWLLRLSANSRRDSRECWQ